MQRNLPIILDNGTGTFKAGFAEDFNASVTFPTIVGTPKNSNLIIGMDQKDFFVGNEANSKRSLLNITNPVQKGMITDWNKMKQIWEYTFESKLVVDAQDSNILTSEPPNCPKSYKEKMAETFFESFKVENYYSSATSIMALYSSGKTTGLILESGEGITHAVPIYEGYAIPYATINLDIGGKYLTDHMIQLLQESKENPKLKNAIFETQTFQEIKEKYCQVAFDYDSSVKEYQKNKQKILATTLPDGTEVFLTDQSFKCPEILFQPNKTDKDFYGIHEAVYQSILRCNPAIRKELYANIQLAGGNTMFQGINQRLFKEISALAPSTMTIKTKAPQERKQSVWIGGSILSSLSSFKQMWVNIKDYKEYGASIVHRKIVQQIKIQISK